MTNRRLHIISFLGTALFMGVNGCQRAAESPLNEPATSATSPTKEPVTTHAQEGHSHGAGPHGGTIADWGGGAYHVEFTVDHAAKKATVYFMGGDAQSPAPIAADSIQLFISEPETEIVLTPEPLEGEMDGKASRFSGSHENLGIVREFTGTISGEVNGTPYSGDFAE